MECGSASCRRDDGAHHQRGRFDGGGGGDGNNGGKSSVFRPQEKGAGGDDYHRGVFDGVIPEGNEYEEEEKEMEEKDDVTEDEEEESEEEEEEEEELAENERAPAAGVKADGVGLAERAAVVGGGGGKASTARGGGGGKAAAAAASAASAALDSLPSVPNTRDAAGATAVSPPPYSVAVMHGSSGGVKYDGAARRAAQECVERAIQAGAAAAAVEDPAAPVALVEFGAGVGVGVE